MIGTLYFIKTGRISFSASYAIGESMNSFVSNYLTGSLQKESLDTGQWSYEASMDFYFTGQAAGNFMARASVGKNLKDWGDIKIGFQQALNNAPYNFSYYRNAFFNIDKDYTKESRTQLYANWDIYKWGLQIGAKNYLIANYIYLNEQQTFSQYNNAFNITQLWINKTFRLGKIYIDNELAYQQKTTGVPVNIPLLMGRSKLFVETYVFKNALKLATGFDTRYHTSYTQAGYSPFYNRYYYQDAITTANFPELAFFFNFKVKNFRAYIMVDQLQQLFTINNIYAPGYPAPNMMLRFGFTWVMIN